VLSLLRYLIPPMTAAVKHEFYYIMPNTATANYYIILTPTNHKVKFRKLLRTYVRGF